MNTQTSKIVHSKTTEMVIKCIAKKTFLEAASTRGLSCQPSRERGWERRDATVRVDWLIVSLKKS